MGHVKCHLAVALYAFSFWPSPVCAAGQVLPDELTLNVGDVKGVGANVTLVLTKRSMRSADYLCGVWRDGKFSKLEFPVSTYRGYVQGNQAVQLNANIEPGNILNVNFTAGRQHIATIRDMKIKVPETAGNKCTPFMSTGNKVVPLKSLPHRKLPTPSGCLVPPVPMRLSKWCIRIPATYTAKYSLERVVSRVEQRWNDGDQVFSRDVGTAWEIGLLMIQDPASRKPPTTEEQVAVESAVKGVAMYAGVSGVAGRNHGKGNSLSVSGDTVSADILLHEGAHLYGDWCHQLDPRDGLFGGGAFWGRNNVQIMVGVTLDPKRYCHREEDEFPGVIYNGVVAPSAMRDMANTHKDQPVTIDVLENDYDGNNDDIFLEAVAPKSEKGGAVVVHKDGKRAVYTPPPGFVGLDTFTYTVADSTGAANCSGIVKVDVRTDGLAVYCPFEDAEKDGIEWMRKAGDWRLWNYEFKDPRPESQKLTYHFQNLGPYDAGSRATAHWVAYVPVSGVRGNGLLTPPAGDRKAQVDLTEAGDPGRWSLSASVWVLYPQPAEDGVILCKSPYGFKTVTCGWGIRRYKEPATGVQRRNKDDAPNEGFSFFGHGVRVLDESQAFEVHSEDLIETNKWYHLVMVMDREVGKVRAYVNNKEATATTSTTRLPDSVIEYHAPLRLFNGPGWKAWNAPAMLADEVKIFTCALTPRQVAELYNEGNCANGSVGSMATVLSSIPYASTGSEARSCSTNHYRLGRRW